MSKRIVWTMALFLLALSVALTGCSGWELEIFYDGYALPPVTRARWNELAQAYPDEVQAGGRLRLERVLWEQGVPVVEWLIADGQEHAWNAVHDDAWLRRDGRVEISGTVIEGARLELAAPSELALLEAEIVDLAPTIAEALGVSAPTSAEGRALDVRPSRHVAYIFIDGLGYRRYLEVRDQGVTPQIDYLPGPQVMLTVYPSITRVATAAMLTGAGPATSGVADLQTRDTDADTIFDVLARTDRRSVIVEGAGLPFNYRHADVRLSRDVEGHGLIDGGVQSNAFAVIAEGMPDLLWVHYHDLDDVGHAYGPRSPEEVAVLRALDSYIGDLLTALPEDTLVIMTSDHGMRPVNDGERRGNHGTLSADDMLVPLWVFHVDELR